VLDRLWDVGDEFLVCINPSQTLEEYRKILVEEVKVVRDMVDIQTPLTGLVTALAESASEYCFVTSCDMPFVDPTVVRHLFERARDHDAAVPRWSDGRLEPLQAVYARNVCMRAGLDALYSDRRGIVEMIESLDSVAYPNVESEIASIDPLLRTLENLNTPEDFERAEAELT
jgi:molybdopterin-guanine dinucleotide biosynthesis protein A